jgi:chorismate synthase
VAGNSFGRLLRVTTAGESHGPGNVVIIDGVPAGMPLAVDDFRADLARRRPGQSAIVTQRKEADEPELLAGIHEGRTTGTSIAILIRNADQKSSDYDELRDKYRPGHADFTFDAKYGRRDHRGGGRSSARETVARVAAGVIAKKLLASVGCRVLGYVKQVGERVATIADPTGVTLDQVEANPVRCPDQALAARMIELIERVRSERDSIGGIAELVAVGVPAGLGEPVFDKLKADLGKALLSLPAVTGFEYGAGFAVATARGSENCDPFVPSAPEAAEAAAHDNATLAGSPGAQRTDGLHAGPGIITEGNRHGGMLGGITSGMPIVCRVALKPTSSIPQPLRTVTRSGEPTTIATRGRHDPCLLPRFVPMGEAMLALTLADHLLRHRAVRGFRFE